MSSACPDRSTLRLAALATAALLALPCAGAAAERTLRVCAEPDNLPLSNENEAGFENRIARLVADELRATLVYEWQPQRRGFVRKTIGAGVCDVWIGVPAGLERMLTTRPYYRSGYVFLNRADAREPLTSFADARLARLRIGVQLIGDDLAASPPALVLARAGATEGVVGYPVYGERSAAERISADLAAGRLDAALVWGPQAGYFIDHAPVRLAIARAVAPANFEIPFEFAISVGVGKEDAALRRDLDLALERRAAEIDAILEAYHVPRLADSATTPSVAARPEGRR